MYRVSVALVFVIVQLFCSLGAKAAISTDYLEAVNQMIQSVGSIPTISYKQKLVTIQDSGNVMNTYQSAVTEMTDDSGHYIYIKFNDEELFLSYIARNGVQRLWLGRVDDLPEIEVNNFDDKLFNTAIRYSIFNLSAIYSDIPLSLKSKEGFNVIYMANKNKLSKYKHVEVYINKESVPVRVLFYNAISTFPVVEVLVEHYTRLTNKCVFFDKLLYIDRVSHVKTEVMNTDVNYIDNNTDQTVLQQKANKHNKGVNILPSGLLEAAKMIEGNTNLHKKLFSKMLYTEDEVRGMQNSSSGNKTLILNAQDKGIKNGASSKSLRTSKTLMRKKDASISQREDNNLNKLLAPTLTVPSKKESEHNYVARNVNKSSSNRAPTTNANKQLLNTLNSSEPTAPLFDNSFKKVKATGSAHLKNNVASEVKIRIKKRPIKKKLGASRVVRNASINKNGPKNVNSKYTNKANKHNLNKALRNVSAANSTQNGVTVNKNKHSGLPVKQKALKHRVAKHRSAAIARPPATSLHKAPNIVNQPQDRVQKAPQQQVPNKLPLSQEQEPSLKAPNLHEGRPASSAETMSKRLKIPPKEVEERKAPRNEGPEINDFF